MHPLILNSSSWLGRIGFCELSYLKVTFRAMVVYLTESFPGVSVSSAQAHHHVHSKTPHHVVLQIPESKENMIKETAQLFLLHTMCSYPHKDEHNPTYRLVNKQTSYYIWPIRG